MNDRIERLAAGLAEPLLVTTPANVRYLTGFESSNAAALVEPDRVRLFADFRYASSGRAVQDVEFVETDRAIAHDLAGRLSGRIAFEARDLTYASWETLTAGGLELVPTRGLVEALRAVKDERELEAIRQAAAIANDVFARIAEERFLRRTERELAWQIEQLFHELGAEGLSFPAIVAAGPNGALPHAHPGARKIQPGDAVVVDAGCIVDGYCSDCTRTFAAGALSDELKNAYAVCLQAQEIGLAELSPGRSGRDVDAAARDHIAGAGLGEAFGHGLGHGVGLVVHEDPRLSQVSEDVLAAGNVVTVEPGIYLEGYGGIRIEDLVVVGADGPEVLTSFTKDLVTVD